jgi:hypothetical protein
MGPVVAKARNVEIGEVSPFHGVNFYAKLRLQFDTFCR